MTSDEAARRAHPGPAVRAAVVLAAIALAAAAAFEHRAWRRERDRLLDLLAAGGAAARAPELARDVARETDPVRAGLRTARGLLADELDLAWQADLAPRELAAARRRGLDKLVRAREIAAAAFARRPASWQAAQVVGATRYLEALRRRLPMDEERRLSWRRPLLAARALGPGQAEPVRFLAAATLSEWSRLSPGERDEALALLADAFGDPASFELLAASWLRLAPSRETAFSVVPADPRAWREVEDFYASRGDWGAFAAARSRGLDALFERLASQLARAEERLAGGDRKYARWFALEVLEAAPTGRRFAPLMARALEVLPAGPLGEVRAQRMRAWLAWSRELCLLGACPFSPAALARMAGLAQLSEPAELAAADEMAGRERDGERRAAGAVTLGAEWAPYHLLRARRLAAAGAAAAARRSLERVDASWRRRAAYLEVAERTLGEADGPRPVLRRPRLEWPAEAWIAGERPALEIHPGERCAEIEVWLEGVPAGGSAVTAHWDGELAGTHPVAVGRPLRLRLEVTPAADHRLEIEPAADPRVRPGRVRLDRCGA